MDHQQELGGAQALLQLGSKSKDQDKDKDKDPKQNHHNRNHNHHHHHRHHSHEHDDHHLSETHEEQHDDDHHDDHHDDENDDIDAKATNQQINDAVEAAVMRYVGGNLDNDDKKSKKRINPDEIMSSIGDFQNWTGFLEDGIQDHDGPNDEFLNPSSHSQSQSHGPDHGGTSHSHSSTIPSNSNGNKRKKRRTLSLSHDIDPELTELDSNSEHDQLVKAAILETRELAKQLGSAYSSLSHLPAHQAQQVLAAMQSNNNNNNNNNVNQKTKGNKSDKGEHHDNVMMSNESLNNINNLVQLAREGNGKSSSSSSNNFKSLDEPQDHSSQELDQPEKEKDNHHTITKSFSHITSIESLSEEASKIAIDWFKKQPETKGPRSFSPEELSAVEYFIEGYCYLYKMDRKQVCQRIWTAERKKDNFWECLTKVLPYRSRASVYKHVRRGYHVFDVRGKWNSQDDELLTRLANTKQGNWKEIGSIMGRMPEDCRDRWRNYIKCGENRLMSRWSQEEEEKLKQIVSDMLTRLKLNTINWTLVSEAMNGTRSRIQCRYKWNKLVKRESIIRASLMDSNTKLWFFEKLKKLNYQKLQEVDWQLIAKLYDDEHSEPQQSELATNWLPSDFEHGFDKMKTVIRGYKKFSFEQLVDKLIDLIHTKDQNLSMPEKSDDIHKGEDDYMWG